MTLRNPFVALRAPRLPAALISGAALALAAAPALSQSVGAESHSFGIVISDNDLTRSALFVRDSSVLDGKVCIGGGCQWDEVFFYQDVLRLKDIENGIYFDDTSDPSYPDRDWRLVINDESQIASGGQEKFAVRDATQGTTPFTILGGAPNNAFYLATNGQVGLGTSIPQANLHVTGPTAPGIRLEQTTTGGALGRVWDMVVDNDTFSVRDIASGTFPFYMYSGAPNASLSVSNTGNVGMGTDTPQEKLHILSNVPNTDAFALFDANAAGSDAAFLLRQNGTVPTTWEFRNQQGSGRLNVGIAGGNTPLKIDNLAANNLLKLGINGNPNAVVVTGQLLVNNTQLNVPDYVFGDDYALRPLSEVQAFIDANSHLPDVPSEAEIRANGVDMTAMQMTLLKKVEELTLYTLELEAARAEQAKELAQLRGMQDKLDKLEALTARIEALER